MDELIAKCYFSIDGKYHPCKGADLLLEYCYPKIECTQVMNMKNGSERELGLTIPRTKKHKGLVLSFCPFCREHCSNPKNDLGTDKIPYYEIQESE